MEKDEIIERKGGITPGQFFAVVFGRKWVFLAVAVAVFIIGVLGLKFIVERNEKTYTCNFYYTSTELTEGKYPNGELFNYSELITLDTLEEIKAQNSEFSDLDITAIYTSGASIELADENSKTLTLVLSKKFFKSKSQAIAFARAIVSQPDATILKQIQNLSMNAYLNLYDSSTIYEKQVDYLNGQKEKLSSTYTTLINVYGDIQLENGVQLSDFRRDIDEFFELNSFGSITTEIRMNGYVKDYSTYKTVLENMKENLNREKTVDDNKLGDLKAQRDQLVAAATNIDSLEISEYNSKIIELTLRLRDIDEELRLVDQKLSNATKLETDDEYKAKIKDLEERLQFFRDGLGEYTKKYEKYVVEVVSKHSLVGYRNTQVLTESSGIKIYYLIGIPLIGGILVAACVNIIIDGKKLTSRFRLVPVEMVKDDVNPTKKEESLEEEKKDE